MTEFKFDIATSVQREMSRTQTDSNRFFSHWRLSQTSYIYTVIGISANITVHHVSHVETEHRIEDSYRRQFMNH